MKTWPYQLLVKESSDGPRGRLKYPDGFASADKQWLHFAYDETGIERCTTARSCRQRNEWGMGCGIPLPVRCAADALTG
jgi:hypothetical protein